MVSLTQTIPVPLLMTQHTNFKPCKHFSALFILFFWLSFAFSQKTIDSLKNIKNQNLNSVTSTRKSLDESPDTYDSLAKQYDKLHDYHKAINYYEKAIYLNKKSKHKLLENYIEIAKTTKKLNTYDSYLTSIEWLEKAIYLSTEIKITDSLNHVIYNNLGNYYKRINKKKESLNYHLKALSIAKKVNSSNLIYLSLSNIGSLYLSEGSKSSSDDIKLSLRYLQESLRYGDKFNYTIYRNIGISYYLKNAPLKALYYHNKALESVTNTKLKNLNSLPETETIKQASKKGNIAFILFEKYYAWIKLHQKSKNNLHLQNALKTIDLADYVLDEILLDLTNEDSKLFWKKQASSFYLLGTHISHLLNDSEKALYFSEKNKAMLLLNSILKNEKKSEFGISESDLKHEKSLKKETYYLKHLLSKNNNDSLKNLLFEKQKDLDFFENSLKYKYPNYNTKINAPVYNLNVIKKYIDINTTCISYIWDKTENQYDALYGVAITKDTSLVFEIKNLKHFDSLVFEYRKLVSKPFETSKELKKFKNISHELYRNLFPNNFLRELIKLNNRLIIIPDNDLQFIPFESLLTTPKSDNYLIYQNEVIYNYSLSFLIENSKLERKAKHNFIGFAPYTFSYDSLPVLSYSKDEVNQIAKSLNGESLNGKKASKSMFINNFNSYKIIHLATHADSNDSISPWIAFYDEKLLLNELYTSSNQAELVVINTCKSNIGKSNIGEGVYSLARGFFYSGTNSIISSLWNVNDKSNQEITVEFYKFLHSGKSKSQSLRLAKINYLKNHSHSEASPYYWASLIIIGENSPLYNSNNNMIYIYLTITLMILLIFVIKKIKKNG